MSASPFNLSLRGTYSTIDYAMEDIVGSSVVCLGVIGVSAEVLKRAEAVNAAKSAFKQICIPLQHIRTRIPVKGDAQPTKAIPLIRVLLRNIQRNDLNLLAAYRKIPILSAPPATVTYTRANTRAVYRKTVDDLHAAPRPTGRTHGGSRSIPTHVAQGSRDPPRAGT